MGRETIKTSKLPRFWLLTQDIYYILILLIYIVLIANSIQNINTYISFKNQENISQSNKI